MLLKGVIDCPDLPLNVSRSALQNDGFVKKISDYISRKVADKLTGMCKTDRENYEKYWNDISPFVKFGCLKDEKFSEKVMDYILYENLDGKFLTLEDVLKEAQAGTPEAEKEGRAEDAEKDAESQTEDTKEQETAGTEENGEEEDEKEPEKTTVYYVTDRAQQSQYIQMFRAQDMDAVIMKHTIDQPFISHVEQKKENVRFQRIDAEVTDVLKEEGGDLKEESEKLQELFRRELGNEKLEVRAENLKDTSTSAMITISEESRRMSDMMRMYGMAGMGADDDLFAAQATLILNAKNPLVSYLGEHSDDADAGLLARQIYDLALLANRPFSPEEMTAFVARSNEILLRLTK